MIINLDRLFSTYDEVIFLPVKLKNQVMTLGAWIAI